MNTTLRSQLLVRLVDQVSGPAQRAGEAIGRFGQRFAGLSGVGNRLATSLARTNERLGDARMRMVDAAAAGWALHRALSAPINAAVKFEAALADVAKVSGFDDAGLQAFGKEVRKVATSEIPMAVDQMLALSAAAAQSGVEDSGLLEFTRLAAKAAVAWGMSGEATGEGLSKIRTQLGLTNDGISRYADLVNELSNRTASSANDLVDYSRRVAAQGEFFGFAAEETLAFGAAMVAGGAESEVAATSFRNMGRALTRGASATDRQRAAMAKLGMENEAVAAAMQKDAVGTTIAVIEALRRLPAETQAAVMSDLFGDEARALVPIVGNLDNLRQTLGVAADETQYLGSVAEEFGKRARTTEYTLQRLASQVGEVGIAIGTALLPALGALADMLGPIILSFAEFAEKNPELIAGLVSVAAGLTGLAIAAATTRYAVLLLRAGLLSTALTAVRAFGSIGGGAFMAARNAVALQSALAKMSGAKFGGLAKARVALGGIARAVPGVAALGKAAGGIAAAAAAISAPAWGLIALGVGAVAGAGYAVYKYWDRLSAIFAGVGSALAKEIQPALDALRPLLDWFAPIGEMIATGWGKVSGALSSAMEGLRGFGGWISEAMGAENLSDDQAAAWAAWGHDITRALIDAIKNGVAGMVEAGRELMIGLWDGLKGIAAEIVAWASSLGSRIASSITGAARNAATGVVDGARDLGSNAWNWVTGGGGDTATVEVPARARGGPLSAHTPTLVGEEGPEIITSTRSGYVHPNGATPAGAGGGAVVNQTIHLHVSGSGENADAIVEKVARRIADQTRAAIRGMHGDYGLVGG